MGENDFPALMDPKTLGILSAAFQGLQASGPSMMPRSLGQIAGMAGSAGLNSYAGAWESQRKMAQTQALVDLEKQKLLQSQAQFQLQQNILKQAGLVPGAGIGAVGGVAPQASGAPIAAGGTPAQGPAPQGGFPFNLNQIAAMKLGGMPDLTATYSAANPPGIAQRPNAPITDPRTGRIIAPPVPIAPPGTQLIQDPATPGGWKAIPIPGAAEGAAGQAGAVAGATAAATTPYKTVEVQLADGSKIRVPESVLTGQGGASPQAPQMVRRDTTVLVPPANQEEAAARAKVQAASEAGRGLTVPLGGNDPWASIPKLETPKGFGQSTYQGEVQKKQAEAAAELSKEYGQKANEASTRLALNNQALDLVDKADTGPLAAQVADVKNLLVSNFGIPENDFKNTPSATIALQKDLVNSATQKAKQQFGSRITQSEVNLMLTRGAPNVDMTKAAIKYLINSDNAMAGYQVKQAGDLGKYLSQGGDPMRFEGWYSSAFPANNAVKSVHLDTGAPKGSPRVGEVKGGWKFLGGDPGNRMNWTKQ